MFLVAINYKNISVEACHMFSSLRAIVHFPVFGIHLLKVVYKLQCVLKASDNYIIMV